MENVQKPKLVIFEGPDKVGKSTIYQAYRRATNYGPLCIDRFITSNEVYDKFYGREPYTDYTALMSELEETFDVYQICLICDEVDLLERIEKEETGVDKQRAKNNMRTVLNDFQNATAIPSKTYIIDTTGKSVEAVVERILRITGEEDKRSLTEAENGASDSEQPGRRSLAELVDSGESQIMSMVNSLHYNIRFYGDVVGNTKERIGVQFLVPVQKNLSRETACVKEFFGDKYERRMEDERFHYDSLKYALLHKVKEVEYFHGQGLDSRKFIIFSQDCISSIQYLVRGTESKLLVHMRSSDVLGLLPLDLLALAHILRALNDEYLPDRPEHFSETISVTVGSLHYYLEGGRD